ncbi:hypothetical protein [Enterococcus raffinosus]|uniref:Uncharacterized protein n=1 Tax=Enterococcus raffinosus TaxID=71452 RepID=A0AAW8TDW7_9ENTE|nr:hypothetical protein [Enterococcus raffinosus]MDT2524165.1 hypothetical protein [Enterococcus raffinosus]MDT2531619.1 hypothetical protein [Enterococcus raffinosus]MDT2535096.1 hypothetical protein [Enterococcus raffinosus]MDT2545117.1 hypothetical protein [Enterococcus raffinosus]MDT2554784.1 hypothetical protein [Enterococcus raffinosus]
MLTKDIVAFALCALGAILGAYTIALSEKRPSLFQMFAACFFSGGSLVFYYYYFENFQSPFLPVLYYTVVIGSAILFSRFKDKSKT